MIQIATHFIRQLAMRDHEGEGLVLHRGIRAIETGGIEQNSSTHGASDSGKMWPSVALTDRRRWTKNRGIHAP